MHFSVDGLSWDIGCTVERTSEIRPSEISGMLLNKQYFNDVIGTFLKYDIKLAVPFGMEEDYTRLYEMLTLPVDAHTFTLPYGGGMIEVVGRVEQISDVYRRMPNGAIHWTGITFSIIANHPTKEMSLNEAIIRGISPMPDESTVDIGAAYVYTVDGWTELDDADDNYY